MVERANVVFVDGARTPFARAGSLYSQTRADDLIVKVIRELLRRNPNLPPEKIDDVAIASGNCRPNECDRNEWYDDVTTTDIAQDNKQ